jgi:hypothetical protein
MITLPELRMQLTEERIALRAAEQNVETVKAIAETAAINAANGDYGKNEEARKRFLVIALENDEAYHGALDDLNRTRNNIDRLSAEIAGAEDTRRQARLLADERHTIALERLAASWEGLAGMPVIAATGRNEANTDEWFQR